MKKVLFILIFSALAFTSFSQPGNPSTPLTKQDYLQKSKKQKTAAWILLGVGLVSTVLGSTESNPNSIVGGNNSRNTVFLVTGLAAIGGSITLFIASSKNKRKAISMSFKNHEVHQMINTELVYRGVPSLQFKISL